MVSQKKKHIQYFFFKKKNHKLHKRNIELNQQISMPETKDLIDLDINQNNDAIIEINYKEKKKKIIYGSLFWNQ